MSRVFASGPRGRASIPGRVIPKIHKMVLDATLHYKVRVKWNNSGKVVAPSPTPRCSSYWKGILRVPPRLRSPTFLTYYLKFGEDSFIMSKTCSWQLNPFFFCYLSKTFQLFHSLIFFFFQSSVQFIRLFPHDFFVIIINTSLSMTDLFGHRLDPNRYHDSG